MQKFNNYLEQFKGDVESVDFSNRIHYEVESEVNPRYKETGDIHDYFGIYYVVKYFGDTRNGVIKKFDDHYTNRRAEAYRYARQLNEEGEI